MRRPVGILGVEAGEDVKRLDANATSATQRQIVSRRQFARPGFIPNDEIWGKSPGAARARWLLQSLKTIGEEPFSRLMYAFSSGGCRR